MATLDCLIQELKELREKAGRDVPVYLVNRDLIPMQLSLRELIKLGQPNSRLTYDPDPHAPRGVIIYTGH